MCEYPAACEKKKRGYRNRKSDPGSPYGLPGSLVPDHENRIGPEMTQALRLTSLTSTSAIFSMSCTVTHSVLPCAFRPPVERLGHGSPI